MRARFVLGFFLLITTFCCAQSLQLPVPPQQNAAWRATGDIPTNIISAANAVFTLGFPDPRGCEYREIQIVTSSVWGERGTNPTVTHGWMLPGSAGGRRFAIAWNGLIYPVAKVGDTADLHAEIQSLLAGKGTNRFFSGYPDGIGESSSVFLATAQSTRVLLLLRLGETAAALTNFSPSSRSAMNFRVQGDSAERTAAPANDPYLQFAGDWAWALFDGILSAHQRGDENFAFATAQTLTGIQPKIEAEAARRGFPRQSNYDPRQKEKERPYLSFLDQLPALFADLERREREGPRENVLARSWTNIANQGERITALIHNLDLVGARQWSQPGGVWLGGETLVAALVAEGDPAVEPLLACWETDKRLTRSVSFHRAFFRNRNVLPVADSAREALAAIVQASFGSPAELRMYWQKYGRMKIHERWYDILKDDSVSKGRWLESAGLIVQPATDQSRNGPKPTHAVIPLRGEALRDGRKPSISELLTRRALEISPTNIAAYDLSAAVEMGLRLARWDAAAARPTLATLAERTRAMQEYSASPRSGDRGLGSSLIVKLSVARAELGEQAALEDYANWLRTTRPEQLEFSLAENLSPLWRFATNPIAQAAAEALFGNTNSPWSHLPWSRSGFFNPMESELVHVPAFRRLLARELENQTVCGYGEWRAPNYASLTLTNHGQQSMTRRLDLPAPEQPAAGAKLPLRWCDWIAFILADKKEIARFNPFAALETRDAVIGLAKKELAPP